MLKETLHKNIILKNARSLLRLAALLKPEILDESILEHYHEKVLQALKNFEQQAIALNWDAYTTNNAKYALIAYIDETVLNSSWAGRTNWMIKPLQLEFFGEHTAGEGFFDRLQKLREFGSQYIDLLELYYVCLQLGFKGQYRLRNTEQLLGLQSDLRHQIESIRGIATNQLSSDNAYIKTINKKLRHQLKPRTMAIVISIIVLLIYMSCLLIISYRTNESIAKIDAIRFTAIEQIKEKL